MYYNRTLSESFGSLLKPPGDLFWLYELVYNRDDFDFLIGQNVSREWISVYRGTSRLITIVKTKDSDVIKIDGDKTYKVLQPDLYGKRNTSDNFQQSLLELTMKVENNPKFFKFFDNKKEGYYQNYFSRKFGICGSPEDDIVILDKEAVIGYRNQEEKDSVLKPVQTKYKTILKELSNINAKKFGKNLEKKSVGNEVDFIAVNKKGEILLNEFKDGSSTSGIYLSPIQIGAYYDLWTDYPKDNLDEAIIEMWIQKKELGLVHPEEDHPIPGKIIPVLIIGNYNYKSSAKRKFQEVLKFSREREGGQFLQDLQTYNFTIENGLNPW